MRTDVFFSLTLLAAVFPVAAQAQSPAKSSEQAPMQPSAMPISPTLAGAPPGPLPLSLDVVVTDKSGQPVSGLVASDFKLLDNKQPQNLTSVREIKGMKGETDSPAEAILLLDAINTNFLTLSNERQWVAKFLKANGGELPLPTSFAVLTDQQQVQPSPPSRDGNALLEALDNSPNGLREVRRSEGYWGAVDRNRLSLEALNRCALEMAKRPGRKLLIWISPGWAAFSRQTWLISEKDEQSLYQGIAEVSTVLRLARITLYSVDPLGAAHPQFYYENFLKGADSPRHVDYGDLMLQVIAVQSGGLVLFGNNDLSELIERCVADAKSYYVLSYMPPRADRPNEYHAIQVQADKPGLKARTRTIYYTQP